MLPHPSHRNNKLKSKQSGLHDPEPILSTPNDTSEANATEVAPEKVHLRGLDNLTTKDIRAFSSEYLEAHKPVHIEWIDDTSANIVYENADIARDALMAFAAVEISDLTQIPPLQTIVAKSFPSHPETKLEVRIAVLGDRKQAGARERSRFYLFNPEYDPAERRKRGGNRGGNRYRDRDDGGYRSQRYDDEEQRKRERDANFDVNLYDDDEGALAQRAGRDNRGLDSSSGSDSRGRDSRRVRFNRGGAGKELFPDRGDSRGGRLRNRSASPVRDNDGDQSMGDARASERRRDEIRVAENRQKAHLIKAHLRDASIAKELFPEKTKTTHGSNAFDSADQTADLFAHKMAVPFMDGSSEENPRNGGGFSIRGTAKAPPAQPQTFSIKGAAMAPRVKELFPSKFGDNAGKELFSERLEGRGGRRQKAEDLFH
jgi:hypothetical protein